MKKLLLLLPVLGIILSLPSCKKDNAEDLYPASDCDLTAVTYATSIKPVIEKSCALSGCHADALSSGINLSTYAGVAAVATDGRLLPAIKQTGPSPMPQGGTKLDDCTISKFEAWVNDGAPNN